MKIKILLILLLLLSGICAYGDPPANLCMSAEQVGNVVSMQNNQGMLVSWTCAKTGYNSYAWQQPNPAAPPNTAGGSVSPNQLAFQNSLSNPSGAICTSISPALNYNGTVYTCQSGAYGIAPAGAASSVPIGGVTGYAAGVLTGTLGSLKFNSSNSCAITSSSLASIVCLEYSVTTMVADDATDNSAALRAAITANPYGIYKIPLGTYKFLSQVTLTHFQRIEGVSAYGVVFDFSALTGTTSGLAFVGTSADSLSTRGGLTNVTLMGSGSSGSVAGIYIGGDPNGIYTPSSSFSANMVFQDIVVSAFGYGIFFGNNTWKDDFLSLIITGCGVGANFPAAYANSGEGMTFVGGNIYGNAIGAYVAGGNFTFAGTSFDYNTTEGIFENGGTVTLEGNNLEQFSGAIVVCNAVGGSGYPAALQLIGVNFDLSGTTGTDAGFVTSSNAYCNVSAVGGQYAAAHTVTNILSTVAGGFPPSLVGQMAGQGVVVPFSNIPWIGNGVGSQGRFGQTTAPTSSTTGYSTVNAANLVSTTALNPGLTVYSDSSSSWGLDLGYDSAVSAYQTRLFASNSGEVAGCFVNGIPSLQSSFSCPFKLTPNVLALSVPISGASQHQDHFSIQPALVSLASVLGPVYYEGDGATLVRLTARLSGTISCSISPVVTVLDLGTSASTAYGSATVLASLSTSTSDGAFASGVLSVAIAAGHYLGAGFSAGSCTTAPTVDIAAAIQ